MNATSAPLFKLLTARMDWLAQRQAVISQNIANADNAGLSSEGPAREGFSNARGKSSRFAPHASPSRATTESHMLGKAGARLGLSGEKQHQPYETAPDGNAVILEEQTAKAGRTALDHQLASNIYKKYIGMIKIALGSNGG